MLKAVWKHKAVAEWWGMLLAVGMGMMDRWWLSVEDL